MRSAQIIIEEAITGFFWNVFRDSGGGMYGADTGDTRRSENSEHAPDAEAGYTLANKNNDASRPGCSSE